MISIPDFSSYVRDAFPEASPERVEFLASELSRLTVSTKAFTETFQKTRQSLSAAGDAEAAIFLCQELSKALIGLGACVSQYPILTEDIKVEVLKVSYKMYKDMRINLSYLTLEHLMNRLKNEKETPSS